MNAARQADRHLRRFSRRDLPKLLAGALNRVAFEILDAEKAHVRQIFTFSGPNTQKFLSGKGSFRFDKATKSKLRVVVTPNTRRKSSNRLLQILGDQQRAGRFSAASDDNRVELPYQGREYMAIPAGPGTRTRSGRIRARDKFWDFQAQRPKRGSKAFVRPIGGGSHVVLRRKGKRRDRLRAVFILVRDIFIPKRFRFIKVARKTARREFAPKLRREFQKYAATRRAR